MASRLPIYVETLIKAPLEEVWRRSQTPDLHNKWDLRFTRIEYLPRIEGEPQRFLYATRLGFGLEIKGFGESVGAFAAVGDSSSALKFASDDLKSLIKQGSGYWKYERRDHGTRFLTLYDYETRYGVLGAAFDRIVFRPLISWATAWSFDRFKIWLETGREPDAQLRQFLIHAVARIGLAAAWIYQGLGPKLIARSTGEFGMIRLAGFSEPAAQSILTVMGIFEVVVGLTFLILWRRRAIFPMSAALLAGLGLSALWTHPAIFVEPFNPVGLTLSMWALCATGWLSSAGLPSASNCLRIAPQGKS